ncbi:NUDIX hydrolase [Exilibacterium tricleocarpae]|uniref:Phosphatase NudJ n=1 Tax=Exilibacterium tricleocarpae TaxID=2591008 RepID=A0A545T8K4_9GAMM|nr:NUDIX hydrolase [Exilibacterium tricleocarpae]TQV73539.1 NUDIX hydrolase [Exilibacterium tricleocarpae]
MEWYPHVTVASVIEDAGRYLLVHELSDGQRVYNQPAGHLEPDESLFEAARRETLEETAWEVRLTQFLGVCLYRSPHNGITYVRNTFSAVPLRHHPHRPLDAGIEAAVWLTYEEILQRRDQLRSPIVLQAIDAHRAGRHYPLDLVHDHR